MGNNVRSSQSTRCHRRRYDQSGYASTGAAVGWRLRRMSVRPSSPRRPPWRTPWRTATSCSECQAPTRFRLFAGSFCSSALA